MQTQTMIKTRRQNYTRDSMPPEFQADEDGAEKIAKALAEGFEWLDTVATANDGIADAIKKSGTEIADALNAIGEALHRVASAIKEKE